jgi:hypothetical protein
MYELAICERQRTDICDFGNGSTADVCKCARRSKDPERTTITLGEREREAGKEREAVKRRQT